MAKSFLIRSIHRNAMLALSHASRLKRQFDADVSTYRFNKQGKRSTRGKHYTFKVTPHQKKLWRIIVGFPYLVNKKKQKSPDARTMKAIFYAQTKDEVLAEKSRLRREAKHEVSKVDKAWIQTKSSHPLYRKINVQVSQVEYDKRLEGITTYVDD